MSERKRNSKLDIYIYVRYILIDVLFEFRGNSNYALGYNPCLFVSLFIVHINRQSKDKQNC